MIFIKLYLHNMISHCTKFDDQMLCLEGTK